MIPELSANTQAILLLTAPLVAARGKSSVNPLSAGEYRQFARQLRELRREPADLLTPDSREVLNECWFDSDPGRLDRLLCRGFLLSQAMERWRTRAIWVVSRADGGYPRRLKKHLGADAPPILYGCGDAATLDTGGLAVVGSRNVSDTLIEYTEGIGRLAATALRTLVSGGARGIDQAAMRGTLEAGGHVIGVLGDGLERAAMRREYRDALMNGRLVLVCPFDPAARFLVGHAMQRNKLIYALSDAALVVNSDFEKGGTWTGAVEQLDKLKFVPVFVRTKGETGKGIDGLRKRGALPWPNPATPEAFDECLGMQPVVDSGVPDQRMLSIGMREESASLGGAPQEELPEATTTSGSPVKCGCTPADELFIKVRELLEGMAGPRTESGVAEYLQVSKAQAGVWLNRIVDEKLRELFKHTIEFKTEVEVSEELRVSRHQVRAHLKRMMGEGVIEKRTGPVGYRTTASIGPLFDQGN